MTTTSTSPTAAAPPPTRTPRPLTFVCSNCGSDDIVSDAWAEWSIETQQWQLGQVFDQTFCLACESDCSLLAEDDTSPLTEPPTEP